MIGYEEYISGVYDGTPVLKIARDGMHMFTVQVAKSAEQQVEQQVDPDTSVLNVSGPLGSFITFKLDINIDSQQPNIANQSNGFFTSSQ